MEDKKIVKAIADSGLYIKGASKKLEIKEEE